MKGSLARAETRYWTPPEGCFRLESGVRILAPTLAWRSWGDPRTARDQTLLVCHPLTASADLDQWWGDLLGPGRLFDPGKHFIVCANVLGGCYGSTGPASTDPATGKRYGPRFPAITIRDMVRFEATWIESLGISRLALVIGGSLGGMRALEWGALFPERVGAVVAIATSDHQPPWAIAFSEAQRLAIEADPHWSGGAYPPGQAPLAGLRAARAIAMLSYRHWGEFAVRFDRRVDDDGQFEVAAWLTHHGDRLAERFDVGSYVALTRAMDTHDLDRDRRPTGAAWPGSFPPTLVLGIPTDLLYPPEEQRRLARGLPGAKLAWLDAPHGHDAFLIETAALATQIGPFLESLGHPSSSPARRRVDRLHPCTSRYVPGEPECSP